MKNRKKIGILILLLVMAVSTSFSAFAQEKRVPKDVQTGEKTELLIKDLIDGLAQEEENVWRKAIYQAGFEMGEIEKEEVELKTGEILIKESAMVFLRSFNPNLKELGKYEEGKADYLDRLLSNTQAFDLEITVEVIDGEISEKGEKAVKNGVSKAATATKEAFESNRTKNAIIDRLFPEITTVKDKEELVISEEFSSWFNKYIATHVDVNLVAKDYLPLFYAQRKQVISFKGGPHEMILTCTGPEVDVFLTKAEEWTFEDLSKISYANQNTRNLNEEAFIGGLSQVAMEFRKGGKETFEIVLDIDRLREGNFGDGYYNYLQGYTVESAVVRLGEKVVQLPDHPAQPMPKTARLSGGSRGTKIIVNAPAGERAYFFQVRKVDTEETTASGFIRPGEKCTVYSTPGQTYFLLASGNSWYGDEHLFGKEGIYSKTESLEIMGSKYYHTITLEVTEEGNMGVYGTDIEDFFQ
ncbi:MAG: hypothetical protein GX786_06935 [Clostridiales bacterium]|nr:hypothetical protein [Clostridiales bacterium]